VLKFKQFINK